MLAGRETDKQTNRDGGKKDYHFCKSKHFIIIRSGTECFNALIKPRPRLKITLGNRHGAIYDFILGIDKKHSL